MKGDTQMQIIIDIPEELFNKQIFDTVDLISIIAPSVHNGVPLPKGHGRLIDENEAIKSLFDYHKGKKTMGQCVNDTPTVLEADKEI